MRHISEVFKPRKNYSDQLDGASWSHFARDIRQSRNNTCESCKRTNLQTNVHHLFYDPARKPWEYESIDVVLLCHSCHAEIHERLKEFRQQVFRNLNGNSFRVLNGALKVGLEQNDPLRFCYAIAEMASSPGSVERFCEAWIKSDKKIAKAA